jgi:hypothetical protein
MQGDVKAPTMGGIADAAGKLNDEGDDLKDVPPVEDARADANATHSSYKESNEN